MSGPEIKGWCPSAHRPMMSADGLVVRIKPYAARLGRDQVLGLCELAERFGNGSIDLTNRANLQLRGVMEEGHAPLLHALAGLGLVDTDPELDARRNILVTPFYALGDVTENLENVLVARLSEMPDLPSKFGFVVDTGVRRLLTRCSGDIRLERARDGGVLVRADGVEAGVIVPLDQVVDQVIDLARWFVANASDGAKRMKQVVDLREFPSRWRGARPVDIGQQPCPGILSVPPFGRVLGAPFGRIRAQALAGLIGKNNVDGVRLTPWRLFVLEGAVPGPSDGFITDKGDPLLRADACTGFPNCPQASVETQGIARELAKRTDGSIHVSGCSKGCARPGKADLTLVGRNGRFDLVKHGRAGDEPIEQGLRPETLLTMKF